MGWFDDVRGSRPPRQLRTPGYQPSAEDVVSTDDLVDDSGAPSSGNTGVSGYGDATTPPPPVVDATRTTDNMPRGVDAEKWLSGHQSPKYLWKQAQTLFDQSTPEGRAQTLAYVQQQAPQWFSGWTIDGDRLRYGGDLNALHEDFDGFNAFDAWKGSKAGEWGSQWLPVERNGQAYDHFAASRAAMGGAGAGMAAAGSALPNSPMTPAGSGYGVTSGQGLGAGFGSLLQPWAYEFAFPYFEPPKGAEVFDDPGYQFRRDQGAKAIERAAAARGTVLNPATVKALEDFNSGLASQEYANVYNRRLGEHARAHDQAFNEFTTAYNVFNRNQDAPFNRLAAIAGLGQTSAGQLGAAGSAFAGNYGNTLLGGANAMGDFLTQGANAQAAGRIGGANAWNQALGNTANAIGQSYYNWQYGRPPQPNTQPPNFPGRWW